MRYSYVFVVLVYKNTSDLRDFFQYFNIENSKVITVNSYYDDETNLTFQKIAQDNNSDYITVPNKGYGAGNNAGIQYALQNYVFDHLVVSNPDIIICSYVKSNQLTSEAIIAPMITTLTGKQQNPYSVYCNCFFDRFKYISLNSSNKFYLFVYYSIIKISRLLFLFYTKVFRKNYYKVAVAHGAHMIIPYNILKRLHPIFNEEMFLFCEEDHLAKLAKIHDIPICYYPNIRVIHKEDGSVGATELSTREILRKSYNIYYHHWNKSK